MLRSIGRTLRFDRYNVAGIAQSLLSAAQQLVAQLRYGIGMRFEALIGGKRMGMTRKLRIAALRYVGDGGPLHEVQHRDGRGGASPAAGRQDMIGPDDEVAEGGRRVLAEQATHPAPGADDIAFTSK